MYRTIKRIMDIVISLAALTVCAPFFPLVAIAIKLDSSGPVFHRQERVGKDRVTFALYKLRSMAVDAEAARASLAADADVTGPVFKMRNDPRITRVGRLLRKYSIDELPQLANVLAGQMSLVGPRPPLPAEVENYEPWQLKRLAVKPGLTCIWQVSGRSLIPFERWVEMDIEYVENQSLWLDVKLLLRTIPAVLTGRGAY
jgi:exopolysaccharide biosynthesis polyprenyl glycosylphosphotransferase